MRISLPPKWARAKLVVASPATLTAVRRGGGCFNTAELPELATDLPPIIASDTESIEQRLNRWHGPIHLAIEHAKTSIRGFAWRHSVFPPRFSDALVQLHAH